jgi:hypothetical protein
VIAVDTLVALVCGDLEGDELDAVEAHVLGCTACTERVDALYATAAGVWRLVRAGSVRAVITDATATQLRAQGVPMREYRLAPGQVVPCGIGADERYALTGYQLPQPVPERVDVLFPGTPHRQTDVPVDRVAGMLWTIDRGDFIRAQPSQRYSLRLVGVAADGTETPLADYTLDHTAFSE